MTVWSGDDLAQAPLGTVVYDRAGHPRRANPAFERMWGIHLADVAPDYSVHRDPRLAELGVLPLVARAFEGEAVTLPPMHYDTREIVGTGCGGWIRFSLYPVRDATGAIDHVTGICVDVSDQVFAEQQARVVAEEYRLAAEAADLPPWWWDGVDDRIEGSERFRELFGLPDEGRLRLSDMLAQIHPDDRVRVETELRRALARGEMVSADHRVVQAGGRVRWVALRGRGVPEAEGRPARLFAIAGDISIRVEPTLERERLLRELAAERARLAQVFELAPAFLAVLRGPEHVFALTNAAYDRLLGGRPLIGRTVREAVPEAAGQGFFELIDQVYRTGEPFVGNELSIQLRATPDGPLETRFMNFVYQPIREADGAISGVLAHGVDVTEQVVARHRAEEMAERFRLVNRATNDIIWDWDLTTDAIVWNDATLTHLGITPEELGPTVTTWYEGIHPDDRERVVAGIHAAIDAGRETWSDEYRFRRHDGGYVVFLDRGLIARGPDGRAVRMIGAMQNVTAERESERTMREAHRMQAVGKLAGGVAHEVNNMMTAVIGFGEFVLKGLGRDHPQREDVQEMVKAATRAANVTRQLLAFSRQQVLRPTVLDLGAVARELAPALERTLGVERHLIVSAGEGCTVFADRTQVEQVLVNLVANARDAMAPGGTVAVDLTCGERRHAGADGTPIVDSLVRLVVRDTGHGMDAETRARVFEPFFTTKPIGQGTGLGLSVVLGVVQQSGGDIEVTSEPGAGTTFVVTLPRVPAAGEAAEPRASRDLGGSETILVVEDEALVRTLAQRTLEEYGYSVYVAADGAEGLALFDEIAAADEPIDLVLTDLAMPHLGGRELADAVAERRPDLPVIFMSGYTSEEVAARGLGDGRLHLQKPFTPEGLVRQVRERLDTAARRRTAAQP